jgi:hypothetical protein
MTLRALGGAVLSLLLAAVGPGCSSEPERPPSYPITGTVTWKGEPVEGARVVFVPAAEGVEPAVGITDAQGRYSATTFSNGDGAQAGDYQVKVSKYDVTPPTREEMEKYKELTYEQEQAIYSEDELPTPPAKNLLPKKYESETTSGISHKVTDGPSTLDIIIEG